MASKRQRRQKVGGRRNKTKKASKRKVNTTESFHTSGDDEKLAIANAEPPTKKQKRLSEFDQAYVGRLVEKYGTDLNAMFKDRKLNPDQLTVRTLERMHALWQRSSTWDRV